MMQEMIKQYLEYHLESNQNDEFQTVPSQDASFKRSVSGLSIRNTNLPALAGGCLAEKF